MKTSTTIALALATALSGSLAAYAQTEQPTVHRHITSIITTGRIIRFITIMWRTIRLQRPRRWLSSRANRSRVGLLRQTRCSSPMPHPGDGDDDGLSRDPDDCNKGCIGGNPG